MTKNYCCQDCGNLICESTALVGKGRCNLCSHRGINHPLFGVTGKNNPNFGRKASIQHCGNISKANKGRKFSKEHRLHISEAVSGKNHNNWQGGISFYSLEFTNELKSKIRCRDSHKCQNCGITEEEHVNQSKKLLPVHHIDYDKQNCKESNLITTCISCNVKANYNKDYWYAYYTYLMENR